MATPDGPDDEGNIADTGMFKRFVEYEKEMDEEPGPGRRTGPWIAIGAIIVIIVIAVVVWSLVR